MKKLLALLLLSLSAVLLVGCSKPATEEVVEEGTTPAPVVEETPAPAVEETPAPAVEETTAPAADATTTPAPAAPEAPAAQ